jgi:predicted kinase
MKKLIIMRGLPGGGKSTYVQTATLGALASGARSIAVCSTDDQFLDANGNYVFDASKLGVNHKANQDKAARMMAAGVEFVYIDNTNTTHKEMRPYKDLAKTYGYEVEEVLVGRERLFPGMDGTQYDFEDYIDLCTKRNTHGVPRDAIMKMARRFEP